MRANQVENVQVEIILAASVELAGAKWKIALHDGRRDRPAIHTITEPHSAARCRLFWTCWRPTGISGHSLQIRESW